MTLHAELVCDLAAAERLRPEWDALAVATARPYGAPSWLLAWWRHVAPAGAELRILTVRADGRLVGLAPLVCAGREWRLLGAPTSARVEPLALPGRQRDVAVALAALEPELLRLEGVALAWPELVRAAWPGRRPWLRVEQAMPSPTMRLDHGKYEFWLKGKSGSFRKQMRRVRRQLDAAGARFALATTEEELERGVRAFAALHRARWAGRGGSGVLVEGVEQMLVEAGRELLADGRFRLWSIEVGGRIVSAQVFLAAGGELAYWLGGFDEAWAQQQPSLQALLATVEHGYAVGDQRLDLGAGDQPYKLRFADGADELRWATLVPRGRGYLATRTRLAPAQARRALAGRLPERQRALVRSALRAARR